MIIPVKSLNQVSGQDWQTGGDSIEPAVQGAQVQDDKTKWSTGEKKKLTYHAEVHAWEKENKLWTQIV